MTVRRQERRGTAAQWATANPVLAAGELGVILADDTDVAADFKIGNGVTAWNDLPSQSSTFDSGVRQSTGDLGTRQIQRFGPFVYLGLQLTGIPGGTYSIDVLPPGVRPAVPLTVYWKYGGSTYSAYFEIGDGNLNSDDSFPAGLYLSVTVPTTDTPPDPEDLEAPF